MNEWTFRIINSLETFLMKIYGKEIGIWVSWYHIKDGVKKLAAKSDDLGLLTRIHTVDSKSQGWQVVLCFPHSYVPIYTNVHLLSD